MSAPFFRTLAAAACLAMAGHAAAAADGAALYQARCVACHGAQGAGSAALLAPPLAGHDEAYVARQLTLFRSRQRGGEGAPGPVAGMQAVAQALPDDEAVAALARHVAKLKPPATKAAPAQQTNDGKAVFSICMGCHGSGGEGNAALAAPRLNHLPAWYTLAQLKAYRADQRGAHADDKPGQQMRQVAKEALADDAAAKAVADYIAALGTGRR